VHSAEWTDDIDLKGKRVAIIGTGASAVQVSFSSTFYARVFHTKVLFLPKPN